MRERLGSAAEGWTPARAKKALRQKLAEVDKGNYTKPDKTTFAAFTEGWVDEHCDARGLKRSTRHSYHTIMDNHLAQAFGHLRLDGITVEKIEAHLAVSRAAGVAPASLHRQLALLSLVFRKAERAGLVRDNPVRLVDRPRDKRRKWRILTPAEVAIVDRSFDELIAEASSARDRDDLVTARALFIVVISTGLRRGEILGLHWRCVALTDPDGPKLAVEDTWVRNAPDTPKSEAGRRTVSLGRRAADELFEHRGRSEYRGEDELVFANPRTGTTFLPRRFGELFRRALDRAGISEDVRPFHDLRHSSISNGAAAGMKPEALMARAGHSSYGTTRLYINLSGEAFKSETDLLEQRLWGSPSKPNHLTPSVRSA